METWHYLHRRGRGSAGARPRADRPGRQSLSRGGSEPDEARGRTGWICTSWAIGVPQKMNLSEIARRIHWSRLMLEKVKIVDFSITIFGAIKVIGRGWAVALSPMRPGEAPSSRPLCKERGAPSFFSGLISTHFPMPNKCKSDNNIYVSVDSNSTISRPRPALLEAKQARRIASFGCFPQDIPHLKTLSEFWPRYPTLNSTYRSVPVAAWRRLAGLSRGLAASYVLAGWLATGAA